MYHLGKKNTIKDSQINWRSWSLSEGRQHSHSGNARWEETPSRGMTEASGNQQRRSEPENKPGAAEIECGDTHIYQCFVFFTILEQVEDRVHVCLL